MNVYFISGMCVNCGVFDKINLPEGYIKHYIEWETPKKKESLDSYVERMASSIDQTQAFILIGYSLGGIVMQEMNKILSPKMNILISSIKEKSEVPALFRFAKSIRILKYVPAILFCPHQSLSVLFSKTVYGMSSSEIDEYVSYTSPNYMKWATCQITSWRPSEKCPNLFHIHGTKDQIFTHHRIDNAHIIEGGDHLMVLRKAEEINKIIEQIITQ